MYRNIAFAAVGVAFVATPLIASAQVDLPTSCTSAPTVSCLQSEIQMLVQVLTQLLSARGGSVPTFTNSTTPTSITTPNQPAPGSVSLSANGSSPSYSIVSAGTTGVTLGTFTLKASGDSIALGNIGLSLNAANASPSDLVNGVVRVYEGASLVGTALFSPSQIGGYYYGTTTVSNITIPQNSQATFTIQTNISPIGTPPSATAGDLVEVSLADAQGAGSNSGLVVHSGPLSPNAAGVRIFKSYPIVSLVSLPSSTISNSNSSQSILRFSISASPAGPIGIASIWFSTAQNGTSLSNIQLAAFIDPGYSQPVNPSKGVGVIGQALTTNSPFAIGPSSPLEIPAGATYYFDLRADISAKDVASLSTTLLGDTSYLYGDSGIAAGSNFIWTPNDNGITQEPGSDWTDGFAVSGLPAEGLSETLSETAGTSCPTYNMPNCPAGSSVIPGGTSANGCTLPPTCSVSTPAAAPTCSITAPSSGTLGQTVTVSWTSQNATSASWVVPGKGSGAIPAGTPGTSGSTTYTIQDIGNPFMTLDVEGPGGSGSCEASISVPQPSGSATINQSSLSTTSSTPTITGTASGVSLVSVQIGGAGISTFTVQGNVSNGTWSAVVSPDFALTSGTYTVTVSNGTNNQVLTSGTLTVTQPQFPSCTITETPSGSGYALTWTTQNATTAHLSPIPAMGPGWVNVTLNNSSSPQQISAAGTYTLTVYDASGDQATCTTNNSVSAAFSTQSQTASALSAIGVGLENLIKALQSMSQ